MTRLLVLAVVVVSFCASPALSQINESKEFPGVFHSPAAKSTPSWARSVLRMEVVVKKGDSDAKLQYANGTVISKDGLIVSVLDEPGKNKEESGGIQSASVLMIDGSGAPAEFVSFEPAYGVAFFRVKGLEVRPLALSKAPLVAGRRLSWRTVFQQGRRTFLYSRPLRIHKATFEMGGTKDVCQIIDPGTSSLNADRTGSALVALDGTLVALMGWHEHWNVTPKNVAPRKKLAWAVPASVIGRIMEGAKGDGGD